MLPVQLQLQLEEKRTTLRESNAKRCKWWTCIMDEKMRRLPDDEKWVNQLGRFQQITPLTATILFQKPAMFLQLFPRWWRKQGHRLWRAPLKDENHTDIWTWDMFFDNLNIIGPVRPNVLSEIACRTMAVGFLGRALISSALSHIHFILMTCEKPDSTEAVRHARVCAKAESVYQQLFVKRDGFQPPFTAPNMRLSKVPKVPSTRQSVLQNLLSILCNSSLLEEWMNDPNQEVLVYMLRKIKPFMVMLANPPKARAKKTCSPLCGYATVVNLKELEILGTDRKRTWIILDAPQDASVAVNDVEYEHIINHSNGQCIHIRPGARLPDELRQSFGLKFRRIPKLAFGPLISHGVLIPLPLDWSELPSGTDVTTKLGITVTKQGSSRSRKELIPFAGRCLVPLPVLRFFAPRFVNLSPNAQMEIIQMFWAVGKIKILTGSHKNITAALVRIMSAVPETMLVREESNDFQLFLRKIFWSELRFIVRDSNVPILKAAQILSTRESVNTFFVLWMIPKYGKTPEETVAIVGCTLQFIRQLELPLFPLSKVPGGFCDLIFLPGLLPAIKRVVWQTFFNSGQPLAHLTAYDATLAPLPDHQGLVVDSETQFLTENCHNLTYSRSLVGFSNSTRQLPSDALASDIDVCIQGEPGRGTSVHLEVLQLMWDYGLTKQWIVSYDELGFCLGSNTPILFALDLGLISAWCVCRGLFLPYPLYAGMWRFLARPMVNTFTAFFHERIASVEQKLQELNVQELFGSTNLTKIAEEHYLPTYDSLRHFHMAWSRLISFYHFSQRIETDANALFVSPARLHPDYEGFVSHFEVDSKQTGDEVFLAYVRTLSSSELATLVQFITGKNRLPFLALGEPKMHIYWKQKDQKVLPMASNCVNQLVLTMRDPLHVTIEEIREIMKPIFEFETVFGKA